MFCQSFHECGRPESMASGSWVHQLGKPTSDMGVDLPPFPSHLVRERKDLSTVMERDESNESSRMRNTLYDMGDAILALSASPSAGCWRYLHVVDDLDLASSSWTGRPSTYHCQFVFSDWQLLILLQRESDAEWG